MRLLSIFILFFSIEYTLRTFVDSYKYHEVGPLLEILPLIVAVGISGVIYRKAILNNHSGWVRLKLICSSAGGFAVAKVVLYIQWYWFIAPQYRSVPGDMSEGLGWTMLFTLVGTIIIALSYTIEILLMKAFARRKRVFNG